MARRIRGDRRAWRRAPRRCAGRSSAASAIAPSPQSSPPRIREAVVSEHDIVPMAVTLLRPGALPKTTSGKIQRACKVAACGSKAGWTFSRRFPLKSPKVWGYAACCSLAAPPGATCSDPPRFPVTSRLRGFRVGPTPNGFIGAWSTSDRASVASQRRHRRADLARVVLRPRSRAAECSGGFFFIMDA